MPAKTWTRRQMLKGAGVTLALPWMETLAPRTAKAQAAAAKKRFMNLYFANGTAEFWKCTGGGTGDAAYQLSPIMAPLEPVRPYLAAMTNVSNNAPFGGNPEPSHSNLGASTYSCVKPAGGNNGITVDQMIANGMMGATKLHSLQVGLSTWDSSPDGLPAQHSRSMAWKSATEPLYKVISPQAVFDRLVASGAPTMPSGPANMTPVPDPAAARRLALKKSALDYLIESSTALGLRLSRTDKVRMDQFLGSVSNLEKRVADSAMPAPSVLGCGLLPRPTMTAAVGKDPPGYNRNAHAELMIDIVVMALQCDTTRVVSFMLDDARSDYVYNFIPMRAFSAGGSMVAPAGTAPPGNYHETQHAGDTNNAFATIGHWNAQKALQLAQKLAASPDGPSGSILDNMVIVFNSGMHGGNHDAANIPTALLGSGGKVLKTNTFHNFAGEKQLGDIYATIMRQVFGMANATIGSGRNIIPELLA